MHFAGVLLAGQSLLEGFLPALESFGCLRRFEIITAASTKSAFAGVIRVILRRFDVCGFLRV
jgi:hypothetical protein